MNIRTFAALAAFSCIPAIFAADAASKSGIDKSRGDPTVRAQDDLFRYVNGKWLKEAAIPSDRPADGAFIGLRDLSEKRSREIIESAADVRGDADAQKIA